MSDDGRSIRSKTAIVGIGETEFSPASGRSELRLGLEAILKAVDDAGLDVREVDGLVRFGVSQTGAAEAWIANNLGLPEVRYTGSIDYGGQASASLIAHAAMAVASGQANVVVAYRTLNGRSERKPGTSATYQLLRGADPGFDNHIVPYGLTAPTQTYALMAQRHIHDFGTQPEHFGTIAVTCRENANRNPHAQMFGRPMSMEDYLNAPAVVDPLRIFDCCLQTDGAQAIVVTTAERARDLKQKPVYVRSAMQAMTDQVQGALHAYIVGEDIVSSPWRKMSPELYARADISIDDIDVAQFYDCFTMTVLMQLEDFGFCEKGEAGPFAASGAIGREGALPINTAGGNLSEGYLHGVNHVVEGVRQIRGTSTSQVTGAKVCLVTGGTPMAPSSALVLGAE